MRHPISPDTCQRVLDWHPLEEWAFYMVVGLFGNIAYLIDSFVCAGGGLKLYYHMMTWGLYNTCFVLKIVTKVCWDWYTDMTKNCKTPPDALLYNVRMARTWSSEPHMRKTLQYSLYTPKNVAQCLSQCRTVREQERSVQNLGELSWAIISERAWSFAARHSCPPDEYADFFAQEVSAQAESVSVMMTHAGNVYWLDRERHVDHDARELWNDCHSLQSKVVRIIYAFFERDGVGSIAGKQVLRGCEETLADNKGVEELHHHCKMDARGRANKRQPAWHLQHIVNNSNVIEGRGMKHNARVTKEVWLKKFRRGARLNYSSNSHRACKHKLPASWSRIMGDKHWRTSTELEGRSAASAWHWLHVIGPMAGPRRDTIGQALLSRWLLPEMVFRNIVVDGPDDFFASLGRGKWSTLAWPLALTPGPWHQHRWTFVVEDSRLYVVACLWKAVPIIITFNRKSNIQCFCLYIQQYSQALFLLQGGG